MTATLRADRAERAASASENLSATVRLSSGEGAKGGSGKEAEGSGQLQAVRSARSLMLREPRETATMPDWTISRTPNGSSTRSSAASLSTLPVASMVTASGDTSTTLARNSCTVSRTADRVWTSARTLISISSRCTDAWGSSSTTLITSISLFSCFVTCSSGRASTSTTTVIREMSECSVGPTASESMLKPRRENSPAMRASTPGLFSTRTESVCLLKTRRLQVVVVELRCHVARELDVVVAGAGRDHRPHHCVAVHPEVDHHRHVVDLHRLVDRRVDVAG